MITQQAIPVPPLNLREMVSASELEFFDNPTGKLIFPELPPSVYEAVFDFGCGCGRMARQLMQQKEHLPRRYVGIDIHRGLLDWCIENLSPVAPNFQFVHHDVWSPSYGYGNSPKLAEPFPVEDGAFTLCIATSVFTHMNKEQAEYYLYEVRRILAPNGVAVTTWFFFDNDSFPFSRGGIPTLFTSEVDTTAAVIYDRRWFLNTVRKCGLAVRRTQHPPLAGHQWWVELERRTTASVDHFPMDEEDAEWLCGATRRPIALPVISQVESEKHKVTQLVRTIDPNAFLERREPLPLTGPMGEFAAAKAELTAVKAELASIKGSWGWRLAEKVMKWVGDQEGPSG